MKTNLKKKIEAAWPAFIDHMNGLYWPGCLEDMSQDQINFSWNEFLASLA